MIHSGGKNVKIKDKDIYTLCKVTREIFMEQPVFLELEAPIKICGTFFTQPPLPFPLTFLFNLKEVLPFLNR